ncbi:MAG: two-component hybrid sensor and regulator [Acidobacteria bacterium]|nr:two-component hybrid sensor and regulator [Acidobacteriota bacterium]
MPRTDKRTRTKAAKTPQHEASPAKAPARFPTVGVGASAGGIEAFTALLRAVPDDPGFSIIFVLHQNPRRAGALVPILARATTMPVALAAAGEQLAVNRIYVAPADSEVTIVDGVIHLSPVRAQEGSPIDVLFSSLASDSGSRAIGVILSGALSDGALGAQTIASAGGIVFAQDQSASFDSMPRSAGTPDFILPPAEIARELVRIARHAYMTETDEGVPQFTDRDLQQVFALVDAGHDLDFSHYKATTVERRIRRRMALHKVDSLSAYIELLRTNAKEVELLYSDILIRVTSFFRDPEVFDTLKHDLLPALLKSHADGNPVRVWVPGCATGEEAYSFAIALLEVAGDSGVQCGMQIFGTDVSEAAIDFARGGTYPESIAEEMSPERLRRFFTKVEGGYRVVRAVRDCCIFARQNLTKDPPFSRLDLVSCRNVMIYLGAVLQRKAMAIFHYSLRPEGYLLLGNSETVGTHAELFAVIDRRHKIYQKKSSFARVPVDFTPAATREPAETRPMDEDSTAAANSLLRDADKALLARYSPPGVLINDSMEILQFRGRTSEFLSPAPGRPSFNLMKMVREGLFADLRAAINEARKRDAAVRRPSVHVTNDAGSTIVDIEVVPFASGTQERFFLVLFDDARQDPLAIPAKGKASTKAAKEKERPSDPRQVARLKRELDATREYLQSIIEEQEAMNEELRSANEEIQSSNEELQSTIEEVETAKEELQSTNEELTTLNEELASSNVELAEVNNDLQNLLASVDVPIVMLSGERRIRRFSPGAQRLLNLMPSDAGRLMSEVRTSIDLRSLDAVITSVVESLEMQQVEVNDRDGRPWLLRVRPYRTIDNRIDGAVLALTPAAPVKKKR